MSAIRSLTIGVLVAACAHQPPDLPAPSPASLHAAAPDERGNVRVALFHPARLLVVQYRDQVQILVADTLSERPPGAARFALPVPLAGGRSGTGHQTRCSIGTEWVGTDSLPQERKVRACTPAGGQGASYQSDHRVWVLVVATACPLSGDLVASLAGLRASPADLESTVLRGAGVDRPECRTETTLAVR